MTSNENLVHSSPIVIVWTPVGRDASLVNGVLDQAGVESVCCKKVQEVCNSLRDARAGSAIVTEEVLTQDSIPQIREILDHQASWSDLPLIVLTGGGISTEASLNRLSAMRVLGNLTLLERPIRKVTLVAAVRSALASRWRQFQTRDHIRELEEAHQRLAQANSDLTQFAFAASHDLQEPLRMINAFTQLLIDRHIDPSDGTAQQFATYVRTGVLRMEALLRDLLRYSRATYQPREELRTRADLAKALSDALDVLKVEIDTTGASIASGTMPVVRGDETQLSLVFQNLISNAVKYCKPGVVPRLEIRSERSGDDYIVHIQDNGIGFDSRYSERVFDLFQRLDGTDVPGTGLGLALCRRIVERHDGRIWAASRPGEGSTFSFQIAAE